MSNSSLIKRSELQKGAKDPRAAAINSAVQAGGKVEVTYGPKRFMAAVVGNRLVLVDSRTGLWEHLEEAYVGHGMMIKQGSGFGSGRQFGGYGTMIDVVKRKLIQRAADGERKGDIEETNASEMGLLHD